MNKINYKKTLKLAEHCRNKILDLSQNVQALHIGGSFSSADLISTVYLNFLNKKYGNFILSKGHTGILLYSVLNYLKIITDKEINLYCKKDAILGVHPELNRKKFINTSTGALGHGLGIAMGMALADRKNNYFVLISDGELHEGSTWENALIAAALKLNNLILIIDNNDLQSSTRSSKTHPNLYPVDKKFREFGWEVKKCDGHNIKKIYRALNSRKKKLPFALIAKTLKGYPISFMKNKAVWHYRSPDKKEFIKAKKELKDFYA